MPNSRLTYLFEQYLAKTCTEVERQELAVMILASKNDEDLKGLLQNAWDNTETDQDMPEDRATQIIDSILLPLAQTKVRKLFPWRRVAAAAAVLLFLSVGGYLVLKNNGDKEIAANEPQEKRFKNDVAAPTNTKATITLADGRTVALDSVTSGTLATQGNVNVTKTVDGKIIYTGSAKEMVYNTLTNPRGSKVIDMTLADGSRVWLNAGSSVTYPVAFIGKERNVTITGEAYFEVAHNTAMPFKVSKGEMEVLVMGTHFNVNAYDDEVSIKVTLLEGSVKVLRSILDKGVLIKPGEQAQVALRQTQGDIKVVKGVDVDEVMAWKNGRFYFDGSDIKTMMRQLSRWYNVEVEFKADIKSSFVAKISRDEPITELLKILELTNLVHFKIDGNKIEVIK